MQDIKIELRICYQPPKGFSLDLSIFKQYLVRFMGLIIRSLAFMVLMIMLFSGVVGGIDVQQYSSEVALSQGLQPITQAIDKVPSNSATTRQQQTLGQKMVNLARSVKGAGYQNKKGEYSNYELMDSRVVKEEGIDCSGLVFWAFNRAAGLKSTSRPSLENGNDVCSECIVDRYGANDQWKDKKMWEFKKEFTAPPAENELQPGDLLYVNTEEKGTDIDHVGIYAGDGQVIHSTVGGVKEISYKEWKQKYKSSFFGYGRVKGAENPVSASDLGGINFTSIKLNCISVSTDKEGGINFDLILKAHNAEGTNPGINPINSTLIGATAFVTGLAIPDDKFWVNLNPWGPDEIIDERLKQSEIGRIMLEADLQMKRDFSNYENPCANETGKTYWNFLDKKRKDLVQQCMKKFPGEIKDIHNVQFHVVTRHEIIPDKVYAYTNGTQIYIINATLTINSGLNTDTTDHWSFSVRNQDNATLSIGCLDELKKSVKEYSEYNSELEMSMIQPYIVADVNHGKNYEDLRNVYVALALAQWYKSRIDPSMDIFRGSLNPSGILKSQNQWSPKEIWDQYVYSFYNGEYKCRQNTTTETSLFRGGGVEFDSIRDHIVEIKEIPPEIQDHIERAVLDGYIDEEEDVLFGNRHHVITQQNTSATDSSSIAEGEDIRPDTDLSLEWSNKGNDLGQQGKNDEAIMAYEESIRLDPNDVTAWYNKGMTLDSQGKYDEAIMAYDEVIRLNPNDGHIWICKGNALEAQGKHDEAIKALDEAAKAFDEAIWMNPNNLEDWMNKGFVLSKQGKYEEAIKAYDEAIRLDPNLSLIWNEKGKALKALGKTTESDAAFAKAKELGYSE